MSLTAIGNRQNVQVFECAYPTSGKVIIQPMASTTNSLLLHSIAAYNNTASTNNMAVGKSFANASWNIYSLAASTTSVTAAIQAGSATTIFDTTNNHGFYVQCKARFSMVYLQVSQIQTGSPVYEYTYWNGASWATLNLISSPVYTSTGDIYIPFVAPLDWAVGPTGGSALPNTVQGGQGYAIRARATTAPSQAVQVTAATVSTFYAYRGAIPANQQLQVEFNRPEMLEASEGVQVYFGTANNLNAVDIAYQVGG